MKTTEIHCDKHFSQNKLHFTLVTTFNAGPVECPKQKSHIKLLSTPLVYHSMTCDWILLFAQNSETTLSQCHYVHRKSHVDWSRFELGSPR